MSVWIKASEQMPPLKEEVVILYKDKSEPLRHENLYYGIARRIIYKPFPFSKGFEDWSDFTQYQEYYEVVFWARLYDLPLLDKENEDQEVDQENGY